MKENVWHITVGNQKHVRLSEICQMNVALLIWKAVDLPRARFKGYLGPLSERVWEFPSYLCWLKFLTVLFHLLGILYGTMTLELGGQITIACEKTGYSAQLEFKLKVWLCFLVYRVGPLKLLSYKHLKIQYF